ncbi:hypothetical protein ABZ725_30775 [Streptomyces sp. NPDC006872]
MTWSRLADTCGPAGLEGEQRSQLPHSGDRPTEEPGTTTKT